MAVAQTTGGAFRFGTAIAVEVRLKTLKNILIPLALVGLGTASAQTVTLNPTSLTFTGLVGGSAVSQSLSVSISGGSNAAFTVFPSQSWLTVIPSSGTAPMQVTVTANPTGLPAGTYNDPNFRVVTANQTVIIPVTFNVGAITVSPQQLTFGYTVGSPTVPQGQLITVNGQNLNFSVSFNTTNGGNWLQASPNGNQVNVVLNGLVLSTLAPGTYNGTVTVTQSGSNPINIPVVLTVSPQPPVTLTPSTVNLFYQVGGQNNAGAQQSLTLATTSTSALPFTFGQPSVNPNPAGRNWIVINPTSGTVPAGGNAQVAVSYDTTANLPAGSYAGTVPVAATGGVISAGGTTGASYSLPVNLLVSSNPLLFVPTQALNFNYEIGGATPAPQSVTPQTTAVAASSTTGQLPVSVSATTSAGGNWLTVTPATNSTTGQPFSVAVNPTNLTPGTYNGTITVAPSSGSAAGNGSQTIAVTLTVANDPFLLVSGSSTINPVNLPYQVGQAAPQSQTINLTSSTGAPLNYTVSSAESSCNTVNWLTVGPANTGTTNSSLTVSASNLASLTAGNTCTGTITLTATNPATGNPAINSPVTIPVNLYVSSNPLLVNSPTALTFTSAVGGAGSTQQILMQSTNPNSPLTYTVSETTTNGGSWLAVGPLSGSTASGSNVINVSVVPGLLSAGTYTGSITITSAGVANSPVTIPVTLQVTSGSIALSTSTVPFVFTVGGSNPAAATVNVTGSGGTLNFTAAANSGNAGTNWLSVTPTSGTTPATLTISANPANLAPGSYTGTVTVNSPNAANSPAVINVTLTVNSGTLTATPAPTSAGLTLVVPQGSTAAATQAIQLAGSPGAISFTTSATTATGGNWLTVSPASGTTPATVTISANAGMLAVGTYTGTVTINAPGATGGQLTYNVTMNVVTPISIVATPNSLNFGYTLNAAAPASQTVQITAQGPPGVGTIAVFPYTATVTTSAGGNWLSATPTTGNVPGALTVAVNPTGLAAGSYTGTITVATGSLNGAQTATITVKLTVSAAPTPVVAAVTNAASGFAGALSPGEEVAIYGTNFGPPNVVSATLTNNSFPTTLSNTQVLFDGVAAPIIAVTNGQVNVMVPYGIAGRSTTQVQVSYLGVSSNPISYNVTSTVPGLYTVSQQGTGQGAILDQNLSLNSASNPAAKGSVIAIYMTGEGVTSPASATGQVAPSDGTGLNHPVQNVTVTIGGVSAPVQYAGSAPGLVYGVMQVNVLVPSTVASGAQPVVVTVGTVASQNGVTVAIQ